MARPTAAPPAKSAAEEAPYYSQAARLRACVIPDSGHDINLALNHDVEEVDAVAWSDQYVGQRNTSARDLFSPALGPDCSG
jgi:hypothetical protein